jgi:hypothetical protein
MPGALLDRLGSRETELPALRRVDVQDPDAHAADGEGVAVDRLGPASDGSVGTGCERRSCTRCRDHDGDDDALHPELPDSIEISRCNGRAGATTGQSTPILQMEDQMGPS